LYWFRNFRVGEKLAKPTENFSNTFMKLIDKLAGKETDLKLTFHDLTLEMGTLKAKFDGSVVLDLAVVTEKKLGSDLQLLNLLGHVFKLGDVAVSINDRETLQLKAENKKFGLDLIDKQFVKKMLGGLGDGKTSFWSSLGQARNIAEQLRDEGLTVTISYKGSNVVTIGLNAKPTLSQFVTRTNAIQINDLLKLIELGL
jgi:hypothetical protein